MDFDLGAFKKSVYYYGTTLWDALPSHVRLCEDIGSFKIEINNIIMCRLTNLSDSKTFSIR